jgi:ATP-dependent exoDNAse (exonuclease V) beta subunit
MKTGLFHFLRRKGKTEDSAAPFSPRVFAALDDAKDKEGEEFEAVVSSVFDSVGCLKDGEQKEHLADMVRDVFSNPTEALENKEELSKILDSVYINISGSSIAEIREAMTASSAVADSDGKGKNTNNVADTKTEDKNEDSDGKGNVDTKTEDSDGKGTADTKTEETGTKDSIVLTKEDVISIVKSEIASALGTNETKDSITGVDLSSTKDSNIEHLADIADRLFG